MREELLKIINHYGIDNQLKKLNEECYELTEAVFDIRYFDNVIPEDLRNLTLENNRQAFIKHIEEEYADVLVLLNQISFYYELDDENIADIMESKINRQLERMKEE